MADTTDISGTYDYERGEAAEEAAHFIEIILPERDPGYLQAHVNGLRAHWAYVLTPEGLIDFIDEWNTRVPAHPMLFADPRIAAYVAELASPATVSYSHLTLRGLYQRYGQDVIGQLLADYWKVEPKIKQVLAS